MAAEDTVLVQLTNAWHETITREEGVRRLARKVRSRERRAQIEASIPPRTEHFLTFDDRVFREYVQLGDGPAILLLMLGGRSADDAFRVSLPKLGGVRRWKPHEFRDVAGVLHENGAPRTTFRRPEQPLELAVDVSFVRPGVRMRCSCGWCYWVHSSLDIHEIDWLCCLMTCDGWPWPWL